MFWVTLGLALSIFLVALQLRSQAQRAEARADTLEVRQGLNFEWLSARLPKYTKNMRPTVVVDYRQANDELASAAGASWGDDALKTQVLEEQQDSGLRMRQSWIAKP